MSSKMCDWCLSRPATVRSKRISGYVTCDGECKELVVYACHRLERDGRDGVRAVFECDANPCNPCARWRKRYEQGWFDSRVEIERRFEALSHDDVEACDDVAALGTALYWHILVENPEAVARATVEMTRWFLDWIYGVKSTEENAFCILLRAEHMVDRALRISNTRENPRLFEHASMHLDGMLCMTEAWRQMWNAAVVCKERKATYRTGPDYRVIGTLLSDEGVDESDDGNYINPQCIRAWRASRTEETCPFEWANRKLRVVREKFNEYDRKFKTAHVRDWHVEIRAHLLELYGKAYGAVLRAYFA